MITEADLTPGAQLFLHSFGGITMITVVGVTRSNATLLLEFTLQSSALTRQRPLSELGVQGHGDPSLRPRLFHSQQEAEANLLGFLQETSLL